MRLLLARLDNHRHSIHRAHSAVDDQQHGAAHAVRRQRVDDIRQLERLDNNVGQYARGRRLAVRRRRRRQQSNARHISRHVARPAAERNDRLGARRAQAQY